MLALTYRFTGIAYEEHVSADGGLSRRFNVWSGNIQRAGNFAGA